MNNEYSIQEAATVAAKWWADACFGERQRGTSGVGMIDMMMALTARHAPAPTTSDRERFEEKLRAALVERLTRSGQAYLRVDYGPEGLLDRVYIESGGRGASFPAKTSMDVAPGDVTVSCGYRAPTERLLGAPVWKVEAYAPAKARDDFGSFATFYRGTDEAEARRLFALALTVLPEGGIVGSRFDREKANLSLRRDGGDADN